MKICIVTASSAGYDHVNHSLRIPNVDYKFFTNESKHYKRPNHIPEPFERIYLKEFNHKIVKIIPYEIPELNEYDILIWIDGNMSIVNPDFVSEITSYLNNGLVFSPHFDSRNCAYSEAEIFKRKFPVVIKKQVDKYRVSGFPPNFGLYETGVHCRDMRNEKVKEMSYIWHSEIVNGSTRDQISAPFAVWKTGLELDLMEESFRNKGWVKINAHRMNKR